MLDFSAKKSIAKRKTILIAEHKIEDLSDFETHAEIEPSDPCDDPDVGRKVIFRLGSGIFRKQRPQRSSEDSRSFAISCEDNTFLSTELTTFENQFEWAMD
jgi:hypothetical protein